MTPVVFRTAGKVPVSNAVVAIITVDGLGYLMQLRDNKPDIYYPACWSCFGGAVDVGETPEATLRRELKEEINFVAGEMRYFTTFTFDCDFAKQGNICRSYYVVSMSCHQVEGLILREGAGMDVLSPGRVLMESQIMPFDSFALWMFIHRNDIVKWGG